MIIIVLSKCPPSLRGALSKWLFEISTNVFVGRVTARIRDELWERISSDSKDGRAVLVYNTNNEQGLDFRMLNSKFSLADFDGLKLVTMPKENEKRTSENETE